MDIYKIKDFKTASGELVFDSKENDDKKVVGRGKLIITELKAGVKNPERVNVYINGKFSFSLDIAQVVEFKIRVGAEISEEKLSELRSASDFGKLYQRTLEWVLVQPRSVREVREYLARKLRNSLRGPSATNEERWSEVPPVTTGRDERVRGGYSEFSDEIISRLLTKGYLNDRTFAEWYVENRFVKKGISKKRLKMELMKKGISKEIIDEVLDVRSDEEEIDKMIAKKRAKYDDEKLIQYLCRQGFSYDLVREKVAELN
ncbi:RecX family transcriptional regulator [Candidatus Saccharibacteria bacterium]|nr:RecX family transcriptional regulator [Candidatus Saccharibacteria bacterium]